MTGAKFDVVISNFGDLNLHENFVRLFAVTCLLTGFGKRSRKGYGTIEITGIDGTGRQIEHSPQKLADNLNLLSDIQTTYTQSGNTINVKSAQPDNYPYIESIQFKSKDFDGTCALYQQIGMAVHHHAPKAFLGSGKPRFASSILLSTFSDNGKYHGIVTQLHCTSGFNEEERKSFYKELDGRI
jgi:CRISPR-associated protein Cmr1